MKEKPVAAVVGFEGQIDSDFHVTWGTAAVRLRERLLNPTTGLHSDFSKFESLVASGALTPIDEISIGEPDASKPLVVIAVRQASPYSAILTGEKNRLGAVVKRAARNKITFFVVRSKEALRQYSNDVADRIIKRVFGSVDGAEHLELVRSGLALDPSHPHLNALKVFLSTGSREHLERLARACMKGPESNEEFDEMLNALRSGKKRHRLDYEKGITVGGGLDVDHAASILHNIFRAIKKLSPIVHAEYPFLPEVPPPRLHALQPGSARLEFASGPGQLLGERVARYLELRALERSLKGEPPEGLHDDPEFDDALEKIAHPTLETSLRQKPFEKEESEPVVVDEVPAGDLREESLTLLGVMTGVLGEAGKLEVRIFPGGRGRLMLSTEDDGYGEKPVGLDFLSRPGSVPHYVPAILDILRRSDNAGHQRFYLRGVRLVQANEKRTVGAIPSSVVRGAFRLIESRAVILKETVVLFGSDSLPQFEQTRESVAEWLTKYRELGEAIELSDPRRAWLPSVKRAISMTGRVLVALESMGGETTANELAEEVTRRFETVMRVNNTRREVVRNGKLLEFMGDGKKIVRLTDLGRRYLAAYLEAGGETGLGPGE